VKRISSDGAEFAADAAGNQGAPQGGFCTPCAGAERSHNAPRADILDLAMLLLSDPHAWLRPFYVTLKADPAFSTLAIPLRFVAVCVS
jgi:hypothetical protein